MAISMSISRCASRRPSTPNRLRIAMMCSPMAGSTSLGTSVMPAWCPPARGSLLAAVVMTGPMAAPALQSPEIHRIVEVDVTESAPQQLQGVAGQRVGVLGVDAELLGHAGVSLAEAEGDDS